VSRVRGNALRTAPTDEQRVAVSIIQQLRDYVAARDLEAGVAGGLSVDAAGIERLPDPLPPKVKVVATVTAALLGWAGISGAVMVLFGAVGVVFMPIMMGRQGVGLAMITLTVTCVTAVVSAIVLLAARSAVRVIRRERRGVRSLRAFARFGVVLMIVIAALAFWYREAFLTPDYQGAYSSALTSLISLVWVVAPLIVAGWNVYVARTMTGYERSLQSTL
jgi:lysylphosphatidylglycerol synthetase-like protein (DUF2156 family)